ncbi:GAF domain-containing protein [Photobacterium damselae subsp. damselae]|uniref:GAF domain-containing protein n=1 Tax=Photobacterium damselae TaxID=38293 RepID=UPI000D04CFC2|nr:GAF domain-containing protein [Photobacterium damselae]PSB79689.1 GAF domain-containing protein [Photobacterium damselae subsp. damselae]UKA04300.1 GAF domain-containing protein [Photobacterium damselae subsp. damselae]UKA30738.1 GAF domain-containing protein [Photobacterium damselae subsp. damselae]
MSTHSILKNQILNVTYGEKNLITNLSNIAAILYHNLDNISWVGFYLVDGDELAVGPYQGTLACSRFKTSDGVCGRAFSNNTTINVPDVRLFSGHITCDSLSQSELVIPIYVANKCIGVLDIDSYSKERFSHEEEIELTNIMGDVFKAFTIKNTKFMTE